MRGVDELGEIVKLDLHNLLSLGLLAVRQNETDNLRLEIVLRVVVPQFLI
jgi:hypothetical protein